MNWYPNRVTVAVAGVGMEVLATVGVGNMVVVVAVGGFVAVIPNRISVPLITKRENIK